MVLHISALAKLDHLAQILQYELSHVMRESYLAKCAPVYDHTEFKDRLLSFKTRNQSKLRSQTERVAH